MTPRPFKIRKSKLRAAFDVLQSQYDDVGPYFRDCVITSIRFAFPHGRHRVTIRGKRMGSKETRCMKITEG